MITYIRCNGFHRYIKERYDQLGINQSTPDIVLLQIRLKQETGPIQFMDIYNAPLGCKKAGKAVTNLIEIMGLMQMATIVVKDFNLHHIDWDNRTINLSGLATEVADWVASNGAIYAMDQRTNMNNQGRKIDLSICNTSIELNLIECYTEPMFHTTSDYQMIAITLEFQKTFPDVSNWKKLMKSSS